MEAFDDNEYEVLISNLLHDTNYIQISNMGKMAGLRKQAEVLTRKILNIGSGTPLMLGQIRKNSNNSKVDKAIKSLGSDLGNRLIDIIGKIKNLGNDGTHTQHTNDFSDAEIKSVEDAILDLYALIFIKYFLDIHVSIYTSPRVLHEFSILPPVIRFKTWSYLFDKDKNNIQIVNKLCLSIIKTFNKGYAHKWLEENKETIISIPYPTEFEIERYVKTVGREVIPGSGLFAVSIEFWKYNNMYDLLYSKIDDERTGINEGGKLYETFEDAKRYFEDYKLYAANDNTKEEKLLHSLMKFVYLGRNSNDKLKSIYN